MKGKDVAAKKPKPTFERATMALIGEATLMQRDIAGFGAMTPEQFAEFLLEWPRVPAERRAEAVRLMHKVELDHPEYSFLALYRLGLADTDERVRIQCIEAIEEFDESTQLIDPLVHLLNTDASTYVRAAAASALGQYLYLGVLEELAEAHRIKVYAALIAAHETSPKNGVLRQRSVEALGFENNDAVRLIVAEAHASDLEEMRLSALVAMGRSGEDKLYRDRVIADLVSDSSKIREAAAVVCGELFLDDAVEALSKLIYDGEPDVQFAAIDALGEIASDDARGFLKRATDSKDLAVATAAEEALENAELLGDVRKMMGAVDDLDLD